MPEPSPPRDEALKRFDERIGALEAASRRERRTFGSDEGAGAGYRLIGELIGGVLTGLGFGWLLDRFVPALAPWGLIGGVLIGSAASIWMAVRSAARMSARPTEDKGLASRDPTEIKDGPASRGPGEG